MTRPHEPGSGRSRALLWVAPLLVAALAVGAWALFVGFGGSPEPKTVEIVVPAGTQTRLDAGEKVVVMPSRLELRVGDVLLIRNDDDVAQSVGPYEVKANSSMQLKYGAPGVYEGYCPLSDGERYEIVVTA